MRIANPLYDHAFKYLMSNDRLAKKVLSTILEKEIVSMELAQQEIVVEDDLRQFTIYRLDFKALIKNEDGREETVLIEIQKSKLPNNLLRFRSYLGHSYVQRTERINPLTRQPEQQAFPIISIYILGYQIEDIPVLATKIDRKITDVSTKEEIHIQSDFINLLTHTCYVLQAGRLPEHRRTKIEKFMSLFNQAWVSEKKYILDLEEVPEEFKEIAQYLQKPLNDMETVRKLEAEQEIEDMFAQQESNIAYLKSEVKNAQDQKEEERRQKEEERRQKEEERRQKEEERRQKEETILNSIKMALKYGAAPQQIADDLNLPLQKVLDAIQQLQNK
jgi:hypothetical protein